MIKIYGSPRSSSGRVYLLLEELGLKYENMPLDMMEKREHKSEAYLKLNPNGKIPVLIDGDFIIWESMAINYYLAEKYKPELLGRTPEEKGRSYQWSFWSQVELQPPLIDMLIQLMFVPEPQRNLELIEKAKAKVPPMLRILDQHLKGKTYIVNDKVNVADFNVASVINMCASLQVNTEEYQHLMTWFQSMKSRPSFQKFAEKRK